MYRINRMYLEICSSDLQASHIQKVLQEHRDPLKQVPELPHLCGTRINTPQISDQSQKNIILYGWEGRISKLGWGLTIVQDGLSLPCYPVSPSRVGRKDELNILFGNMNMDQE
jgi:hypothetical protein